MGLLHAAAIIIHRKKILLIKRSEMEDSEPGKWCPPNETLKENESPESAVIRGVTEELGMEFVISKKLFLHSYGNHITYVFIGSTPSKIINANSEEVADYAWFSYREAMRLKFAYDYDDVINRLQVLSLIS